MKRIQAYMLKALHEAKVHTSWINPDPDYDKAVVGIRPAHPRRRHQSPFLDDFRAFQRRVSHYGLFNSLSQTLLKLAAPGVPDTYQGTELWDFSLVDPDNRRPVDYARRRRMLDGAPPPPRRRRRLAGIGRELGRDQGGRPDQALRDGARSALPPRPPGLLSAGEYCPLSADGAKADHLFAFARGRKIAAPWSRCLGSWPGLLPTGQAAARRSGLGGYTAGLRRPGIPA